MTTKEKVLKRIAFNSLVVWFVYEGKYTIGFSLEKIISSRQ